MNMSNSNIYKKIKSASEENKITKIKIIQLMFESVVESHYLKLGKEFPKKYKKDIINCLTLIYLDIWLENDPIAKQTLYSFSKNQFMLKNEVTTESSNLDTDFLNKANYNKKKIEHNIEAHVRYSKENNFVSAENVNKKDNNEYSFVNLEFINALGENYLEIYRNIFKNKHPYFSTCRNKNIIGGKSEDIAKVSYEEYKKYLDSILELINKNRDLKTDLTKNNRAFVIKCLLIWKLEYSYRFKLTAELAKYLKDSKIDIDKICIPKMLLNYYCPYPIPLADGTIERDYSYFIKNYNDLIHYGYSKRNERYSGYITLARYIVTNSISLFHKINNPSFLLGTWEDKDFDDAAKFLIDEYGIIDCLTLPQLDNTNNNKYTYYDYIRQLFHHKNYIDFQMREYCKDSLKNDYTKESSD